MFNWILEWKAKKAIDKFIAQETKQEIQLKTLKEKIETDKQLLKLRTMETLFKMNPKIEFINDNGSNMTIHELKAMPYDEFKNLLQELTQQMDRDYGDKEND